MAVNSKFQKVWKILYTSKPFNFMRLKSTTWILQNIVQSTFSLQISNFGTLWESVVLLNMTQEMSFLFHSKLFGTSHHLSVSIVNKSEDDLQSTSTELIYFQMSNAFTWNERKKLKDLHDYQLTTNLFLLVHYVVNGALCRWPIWIF